MTDFLKIDSPADEQVRIFAAPDDDMLLVEIDTPRGTMLLRMGGDDAKKLSARIYASVAKMRNEKPRGRPRAN